MSRLIDLTGQRFGRLTVIERAGASGKEASWLCQCDCGKRTIVAGTKLRSTKKPTRSCGCLSTELLVSRNKNPRRYAHAPLLHLERNESQML